MHMRISAAHVVALAIGVFGVAGCGGSGNGGGGSGGGGGGTPTAGKFTQTNLIADTAGKATNTDANLVNPWGVAYSPGGLFWVANNGSGKATVYNGSGVSVGLVVSIPSSTGGSNGPATGQVYNGTAGFGLAGTAPTFIFDSEDGLITGWTGGATATVAVNNSAKGAVYKGLAMAQNGAATFLYATNFNSGKVEVYDTNYALANQFTDATVPVGYAPFGIKAIGGMLYVTFAKQDGAKHDDVAGAGNGFVDVFTPAGVMSKRLVSNGQLNSPWGLEIAPTGFGSVAGDLLVGNFGDGKINAFNTSTGHFDGPVADANNNPIVIPGLWSLIIGNNGSAGSSSDVYFSSGPSGETHGLFGSLAPVATPAKR